MKTRRPILAILILALVAVAGLAACEPPVPTPGEKAVAAARLQIGRPYKSGGESVAEGGFDCSGLTYYGWAKAGVTLPRTSSAQYQWVTKITKAQLLPGDFVFYSSAGPRGTVSHVALYAGDGRIIQAQKAGVPVKEQPLTWWSTNVVGYGRVPAVVLARLAKA